MKQPPPGRLFRPPLGRPKRSRCLPRRQARHPTAARTSCWTDGCFCSRTQSRGTWVRGPAGGGPSAAGAGVVTRRAAAPPGCDPDRCPTRSLRTERCRAGDLPQRNCPVRGMPPNELSHREFRQDGRSRRKGWPTESCQSRGCKLPSSPHREPAHRGPRSRRWRSVGGRSKGLGSQGRRVGSVPANGRPLERAAPNKPDCRLTRHTPPKRRPDDRGPED